MNPMRNCSILMLSLERQRISSFEKSNLRRLAAREKLTLQTVLQRKMLTHFLENLETDDWSGAQTAAGGNRGGSSSTAEL